MPAPLLPLHRRLHRHRKEQQQRRQLTELCPSLHSFRRLLWRDMQRCSPDYFLDDEDSDDDDSGPTLDSRSVRTEATVVRC